MLGLFIFRPENEIAFSVHFIFQSKKENPFTVGLYVQQNLNTVGVPLFQVHHQPQSNQ